MIQLYTATEAMGGIYRANCLAHARKHLKNVSKPVAYINGRYYVVDDSFKLNQLSNRNDDITLFHPKQLKTEKMEDLLFTVTELHLTEHSNNSAMSGHNVMCKLYSVKDLGYVLTDSDYPINDEYSETSIEMLTEFSAFSEVIVTVHKMLFNPEGK